MLEIVTGWRIESPRVTTTGGNVAGSTTMCGGSAAEPVSGTVTVGAAASLLSIESVAVALPSVRWR